MGRPCGSRKAFFVSFSLWGFLIAVIPHSIIHAIDLLLGSRKLRQKYLAHDLPGCRAGLLSDRQSFLVFICPYYSITYDECGHSSDRT